MERLTLGSAGQGSKVLNRQAIKGTLIIGEPDMP